MSGSSIPTPAAPFDQMDRLRQHPHARSPSSAATAPMSRRPPSGEADRGASARPATCSPNDDLSAATGNTDSKWVTIAEVDPAPGRPGRRPHRLPPARRGHHGDDGNVYDVALSTTGRRERRAGRLQMFSYTTSARMPRRGVITELRFMVPDDATSLTVGNFDAAAGDAFLTTNSSPTRWRPPARATGRRRRCRSGRTTAARWPRSR